MLKQYIYHGRKFQFEESEAPSGAVEIVKTKAVTEPPKTKAITTAKNKAKKVKE